MDELKKAIQDIKDQVEKGLLSKETADEKFKEITEKMATIQAEMKAMDEKIRLRATAMDGLDTEIKNGKEKFSIAKFLVGAMLGTWTKENEGERKIVQEYMDVIARAPMTTTGGAGGYSIPPQAIMTFIEKLYAETVLVKAGARLMTGLTGSPVTIPRQSGSTTGYWVAEGTEITESIITDEQVQLTPKEVAGLVTLNNKLLMLAGSNPSIEALIVNDLSMQIALAIDLAGLRGTASNNQPRGLVNQSGINTKILGADGGYMGPDEMVDMEGEIEDDNALRGKLGYIMHPKIKRRLKKTKVAQYSGDTAGQWIMLPMTDQNLRDILGYPFFGSTQIPTNLVKGGASNCSEVYFGNWDDLIIGQWGGLDIASSNQAGDSFKKNQTQIRAIQVVDIAVRHPESFCVCSDAKVS